MKKTLYVGTYSHPSLLGEEKGMQGRGEGIYRLAFDETDGTLAVEQVYHGIVNPSYLTISADGKRLYAVHELDTYQGTQGGGVSAYTVDENGALRQLNTQPTLGGAPCHVALSPDGSLLTVANYMGGSITAYAVYADGSLGAPQVIAHTGKGPNAQRQDAPHVHSSIFTPDGHAVVVADLGTDSLTTYSAADGTLAADTPRAVATQPGDGPRMCAYGKVHRLLYVVCELSCVVATFACDEQGVPQQWLRNTPLLPEGTELDGSTAADIAVSQDGRFLYASTRGEDCLTVFRVDLTDGSLHTVQHVPSGGKTPRGFTLSPDGGWLLCGNQDSDGITVFAIDKAKGTLARQDAISVPTPVCLVFG